jgi:hypothetical protein
MRNIKVKVFFEKDIDMRKSRMKLGADEGWREGREKWS